MLFGVCFGLVFFFKFVHVLCSDLAVLRSFWSEAQNKWIHPCSLTVLPQQDVLCEFEFFNLLRLLYYYYHYRSAVWGINQVAGESQMQSNLWFLVLLMYSFCSASTEVGSVFVLGVGPLASLINCFGECPFQPPCLVLLHSFQLVNHFFTGIPHT